MKNRNSLPTAQTAIRELLGAIWGTEILSSQGCGDEAVPPTSLSKRVRPSQDSDKRKKSTGEL